MSRDLTCNESLTDEGGVGSNFSPSDARNYARAQPQQHHQQLYNANAGDALTAIRERLLLQHQQQQQQQQQSSSFSTQHNQSFAQLLAQHPSVPNVEVLAEQLNRATSSTADTTLLQQYTQSQRQQQQQQQQQHSLLDNLPSAATLAAALLAQRNVYGGALPSLAATSLGTTNVNATLHSTQPQTSQPSALHQAAALLGVHLPSQSNATSSFTQLDNDAAGGASLLQQLAALQQQQQQSQSIAYSMNQPSTQRLPVSTDSPASSLLPSSFYSRPTVNESSATTNSQQTLAQRQLSELLLAQQQLSNSRADELARQQLQNALRSQYQLNSGGGVETRPVSALVQQALQQLSVACGGQLSEHESEALALATQQQSQLAANESIQRGLLSPYNAAAALPTSQQQQQRASVVAHTPHSAVAASLSHSLLHASGAETLQGAKIDYAAAMQELLQAPAQSAAGSSTSATFNSLAALQQQLQQHGVVAAAADSVAKRSAVAASYLQAASPITRRHLDADTTSLDAVQRLVQSRSQFSASVAPDRDPKAQKRAAHEPADASTGRAPATAADLAVYEAALAGVGPRDDAGASVTPAASIPTLAAFRQVPGQDIFTHHSVPKKKLKAGAPLTAADAHSDLENDDIHRKPTPTIDPPYVAVTKEQQPRARGQQLRSPPMAAAVVSPSLADELVDVDGASVPRRRGRPPAKTVTKKPNAKSSELRTDAATRTILHEAVDIFLKPIEAPQSPLSDRSDRGRSELRATEQTRGGKDGAGGREKASIKRARRVLAADSPTNATAAADEALESMKAIMEQSFDSKDERDAKYASGVARLYDALCSRPNLWDAMQRLPDNQLPAELRLIDFALKKEHLVEQVETNACIKHLSETSRTDDVEPAHEPTPWEEDSVRESVQAMAMSTSIAVRRAEFLRQFIYESALLRLLNNEYAALRATDAPPREVFLDETSVAAARADAQLTQQVPDAVRTMNTAEVECRLLSQMYRYRSHIYQQHYGRPFALPPRSSDAPLTPDETLVLGGEYRSRDVTSSAVVPSRSRNGEVKTRLGKRSASSRLVIMKARNERCEIEVLKRRLQQHLATNFNELVALHDDVYKIRKRAVELHRDDLQHEVASVVRLMRTHQGRRCASIEPPLDTAASELPLYSRRRCRSEDRGVRERVVNRVGVRYIQRSLAERLTGFDELDALDSPTRTVIKSAPVVSMAETGDESNNHDVWARHMSVSERFEHLTRERQGLIAALVKLSMLDADERTIMRAAREPNVAVDTTEFRVFGAPGRRNVFKASIAMRRLARRLPTLVDPACDASQQLTATTRRREEAEETAVHEQSPQQRLVTIKRTYGSIAQNRERDHVRGVLSDRAFHNELLFRHLNCMALKLYAHLDPSGHKTLVDRLRKLEAPRLDHILKRRGELTIGYLYDLPPTAPRRRVKKRAGQENIELNAAPDFFDDLLGGADQNPYRQPLLYPISTAAGDVDSAPLAKYRGRETDATPAEQLAQHVSLPLCATALMRLIYQSPNFSTDLSIFVQHSAFKILSSQQGNNDGLPCSLYQLAVERALAEQKAPIEERKMPQFDSDAEAEAYFEKRARVLKERFASLLTVAHKRIVLSRRCTKTMQKLVGVDRERERRVDAVQQHYAALSTRSKQQFLKRFRSTHYNETTLALRGVTRAADHLQAPLPVPGLDSEADDAASNCQPSDGEVSEDEQHTKLAARRFSDLPAFVRHEILSPPKRQEPTIEERGATRGGRGARGGRGRRARRGGRY